MLERRKPELDERLSSSERAVRLFLEELPRRIDEPWTLESMAEQCGLGRSAFAACCKEITNMSSIDFLTSCRIDGATRLLREKPALSITDIAFQCGFQSSQYFATVFRKRLEFTPREWRTRKGWLAS